MSTKIIFIGGLWLEDEDNEIIKNSKGNVQNAANVLQKNIIKGLDENTGNYVTIINEKFLGSFPLYYKQLNIKSRYFSHVFDKVRRHIDYEVGFLNLPIIKHYFRYWNSKKFIRLTCVNNDDMEKIYVIGYSMSYSIIKGLIYAKKVNPKVKTCLIIPDLPEFMNLGKSKGIIFELLKAHSSIKVYKLIKQIDSYCLLTKHMYDKLNSNRPFTVMEGIATNTKPISIDEEKNNNFNSLTKSIVYTGTLSIKYGVCELVNAFHSLHDNLLRLIICGAGDGENYIRTIAKEDRRIIFKGIVTNKEARDIQRSAYFLVNPRNDREEYTKYSFPSKTMEYMESGRPVIMYKLSGIPDEYDPYLFYVKGSLADTLKCVLSLSEKELALKGKAARNFVLCKKNATMQTKKILDMLNSL